VLSYIVTWLQSHIRSERGQDLLEYAMLGSLIAAAIAALVGAGIVTGALDDLFTGIADCVDFSAGTPCTGGL